MASKQEGRQYATNCAAWRAIREWVLLRDLYECKSCKRMVARKGEAHIDHIDGDANNNPEDGSNWQTLCRVCHNTKTAREDGGFGNKQARQIIGADADGWPQG